MDHGRVVAAGIVAVVAVTAVLSGPLVGGVDLTPEPDEAPPPGSGVANVSVISIPDRAAFVRNSMDRATYELQVPDATVRVANITGRPLLVYKIQVRELGHTRGTTLFLNSSMSGRRVLALEDGQFEKSRISQSHYNATITVLLRSDSGEQELRRENATVAVRR
jgi:hypothetical protein